ncbi:uncharacterized protein J4E84_003199 [Alternaria hordeiaustralica]|uniref:uncharacterized protein n=1 Tax=Alternaria hordeiaustralica TaxID=1187925 RepID=UPI0020C37F11|nr:uncharacterized protein J4E84_003199 [Alternaria hordeiaustralica]KAI4692230.1 hypothetical protein J4E84_003199 [Alternaria hordeiaustralica]
MPTVPVFIVIRSTDAVADTPTIRVASLPFCDPVTYPFITDMGVIWHMVANPFYAGQDGMAMITADMDRDDKRTVKIVNDPRLEMVDAERDLRRLVASELEGLMLIGGVDLKYIPGMNIDGVEKTGGLAIIDHGSGLKRQWTRYAIRQVDAHCPEVVPAHGSRNFEGPSN